ncbi:topoisomerase DNA-binding C4 zinc finger domain-containing protein [Pseudoalteromonas fenneropenaei]|uniref:Topoisomerase DNA-binding C4 zinc finger domain-containing protein n=1 Tax=Pseudoalteromonas fenneropenaei TaxID=1737459 RepID=A0ABV7CL16_9GAMM
MSKIDQQLFDVSRHALEREYEVCPQCGAELVIKYSKNGAFLGCGSYPNCDYVRPLHHHDGHVIKQLDSMCPECAKPLVVRNGRYGMFIGCSGFPACHYIASQQQEVAHQALPACPKCNKGHLTKRVNKFGKHFYSCERYPQCKYSVNLPPVAQSCEACGWPLLVEKKRGAKTVLQCPQKSCQHKHEMP